MQPPNYAPDDPGAAVCYRRAILALNAARVEFLVGGAYSLARYAGISRDTKDLDVFLRPHDRDAALAALANAGFHTEVTYSHWLAKAFRAEFFIDLIYNSGNAVTPVDDDWFDHALPGEVFGERVQLCPAEESLWSKAFIMERNRYDGADIAHVLRARGDQLDWGRLLARFGQHWRVLYSHLILFGYIYPSEQSRVPAWVMRELAGRLEAEAARAPEGGAVCRGTLLAALSYLPDIERFGYEDARRVPHGALSAEQVTEWTAGVAAGQ